MNLENRTNYANYRQQRLNCYLDSYGVSGYDISNLSRSERSLVELAYLNLRLERRGFQPLARIAYESLLAVEGDIKRKDQFSILANYCLLRKGEKVFSK